MRACRSQAVIRLHSYTKAFDRPSSERQGSQKVQLYAPRGVKSVTFHHRGGCLFIATKRYQMAELDVWWPTSYSVYSRTILTARRILTKAVFERSGGKSMLIKRGRTTVAIMITKLPAPKGDARKLCVYKKVSTFFHYQNERMC